MTSLEGQQSSQTDQAPSYEGATDSEFRAAISSMTISVDAADVIRHLDGGDYDAPSGPAGNLNQVLDGRYLPFVPPPVPRAADDASDVSIPGEGTMSVTTRKAYSTTVTIVESTHPNGTKTYTAQASPVLSEEVDEYDGVVPAHASGSSVEAALPAPSTSSDEASTPAPATFLDRKRLLLQRFNHHHRDRSHAWTPTRRPARIDPRDARNPSDPSNEVVTGHEIEAPASTPASAPATEPGHGSDLGRASDRNMYAISVKRQRRLKMKKHKYKKLMRRTRNLRRRLDRA